MYVATGSSVKFRRNTTHVVFNKLEIGAVRFNLQVECTCRFYGVDISIYMTFGYVFLTNMCIEINSFYFVMPFSMNIGIAQQSVVQPKTSDK